MREHTEVRIGLRFRRSQARLLRDLAERCKVNDLGAQHVATFEQAAQAAASGEPLIVICMEPIEAVAMADGYTRFGVVRPSIEQLNGA